MSSGVLAGYPVIGVRAILYDGSYHPVDSSEMAFKIAASIAYKKGLESAKPILLEPIMNVEIMVPDEYMGDVMGDINKKRVLKPGGFLIFKWNETDIKVKEILKLTTAKPIFGHISGKRANTHWICFMKEE